MLDAMSGISASNLAILKKYAPPAPVATKNTPVNGVNIPFGILPVVKPSYTNEYTWLVSSDYNISDKDQLRGRFVSDKTSGLDTAAVLPVLVPSRAMEPDPAGGVTTITAMSRNVRDAPMLTS